MIINKCKEELKSLYDYITDGIILHSSATWHMYEKGEKSTKYFLNLEKGTKQNHMLENLTVLMVMKKPTQKIFWLILSPYIQICILEVA